MVLEEQGIFTTAQNASKNYTEAQIKEEIELALFEIQTDIAIKGNEIGLEEILEKLQNKLPGIDVKIEEGEIKVKYKGYNFVIDNQLGITTEEGDIGFRYTLSGYTNGNVTITITSTGGEIANIEVPSTITKNEDGTYTASANGEYDFVIRYTTGETKTETVKIDKIDKLKPQVFAPTIKNVSAKGFTIVPNENDVDAELDEVNVSSGIEGYEYYINGTKNSSTNGIITGLSPNTGYTVTVKAYDKAGNVSDESAEVVVKTYDGDFPILTPTGVVPISDGSYSSRAALPVTYDGDFTTKDTLQPTDHSAVFKVDESCWGKYLTIYYSVPDYDFSAVLMGFGLYPVYENMATVVKADVFYDAWMNITGEALAATRALSAASVIIPEGTVYCELWSGNVSNSYLYEVWISDTDLTGNIYSNENKP